MANCAQNLKQRIEREEKAHTEKDILAESHKLKDRFPHILQFPSRERYYGIIDKFMQDIDGKTILDYGCGRGRNCLKYLRRCAICHAITGLTGKVRINQAHFSGYRHIQNISSIPKNTGAMYRYYLSKYFEMR